MLDASTLKAMDDEHLLSAVYAEQSTRPLSDLESELLRRFARRTDQVAKDMQAEIDQLRIDLADAEEEIDQLRSGLADAEEEIDQLKSQLTQEQEA